MTAGHGWPMVKLGEVCEINPRLPRSMVSVDDKVAFLPMASVLENGTLGSYEHRRYAEVSKGYTQLLRNDVLVAKITPCFQNRKTALATIDTEVGAGSTEYHVFRTNDSLDPSYLHHYLRQPQVFTEGTDTMTGSGGQRRVPAWYFANLRIPLPPLDEQRRIAGILDRAAAHRISGDEAIDKLHRLSEWLVSELTQQRGVVYTPLGELLESIESGKSPKCESYPASDGEWGVLKLSAVTKGRFVPSENKHLPDPPSEVFRREVQEGDILMTRKNTPDLVGAVCIARKVRPRLAFPDLVFRLRINQDQLLPSFFHALMMSPSFRDSVRALAVGSAKSMSNISQAKLRGLEIPLPPMDAQLAFDEKMRAIYRQIDLLDARQGSIKELHSTLHARAFQGDL